MPAQQLLVCAFVEESSGSPSMFLGEWDPTMDSLRNAVRLSEVEVATRIRIDLPVALDALEQNRDRVLQVYLQGARDSYLPSMPMDEIRALQGLQIFLVGDTVEAL